jgi:hypothetical protein
MAKRSIVNDDHGNRNGHVAVFADGSETSWRSKPMPTVRVSSAVVTMPPAWLQSGRPTRRPCRLKVGYLVATSSLAFFAHKYIRRPLVVRCSDLDNSNLIGIKPLNI